MVCSELNTLPLSAYGEQRFDCECGYEHTISTRDIAFGSGASGGLRYIIEKFIPPASALFYITDECGDRFSPALRRSIAKFGYRVSYFAVENGTLLNHLARNSLLNKFEKCAKSDTNCPDSADSIAGHDRFSNASDSAFLARLLKCPEDVRLIIAAGGSAATELAKLVAFELGLPLIILAACPTYPHYLAPFVVINSPAPKILSCPPPAAIIADTDWLRFGAKLSNYVDGNGICKDNKIPAALENGTIVSDSEAAAGFGELASKLIALFDREVATCIDGVDHCPFVSEQVLALVDSIIERLEGGHLTAYERAALILEHNIRFSALLQLDKSNSLVCGGENLAAHCLALLFDAEQRQTRLLGENRFIFATVLAKVYINALDKLDGLGFVPPPDNNLRAETLERYLGVPQKDVFAVLKDISPVARKIEGYKLREYRRDLLDLIRLYDKKLARAYKIFKRIYNDSGYALRHYIDHTDLALSIALAPDLTLNSSLLSKMKTIGLLDLFFF